MPRGKPRRLPWPTAQTSTADAFPRLIGDIDCDLERKDAYTYTCEKTHVREIEVETVARRLGLPASLVDRAGLPFAYWPQDIG